MDGLKVGHISQHIQPLRHDCVTGYLVHVCLYMYVCMYAVSYVHMHTCIKSSPDEETRFPVLMNVPILPPIDAHCLSNNL